MAKKSKKKKAPKKIKIAAKPRNKKSAKKPKKKVSSLPENFYGQKIEINKPVEIKVENEPEPVENLLPEEFVIIEEDQIRQESAKKNENRHKMLIVYAGTFVIMVAVVSFWLLGVRSTIGSNLKSSDGNSDTSGISALFNDFKDILSGASAYLASQKNQITNSIPINQDAITEEKIKQDIANQIKAKIENANSNLNLNTNN